MKTHELDPIDLEVLRTRLESIGEQACLTIEHTAISPAVTESKDYSVTLLDADGELIIGTGHVIFHYGAAAHAVRSTLARHGDAIEPGDVFLANDPHSGGGLHPQDVMVQQPIFVDDRLVAWVGVSAHLMDMGGLVIGSFAPEANECYQEAFRIPPVRIFRRGEEVTEVWDLLRTNVRMAELVEMDLRGLVASAHLATGQIAAVVAQTGVETFSLSLTAIRELTETELRRRIAQIADGVYRDTSWTEFGQEFFRIPCTLTVAGDTLTFDFEGASPQCSHFFNSKPYIIEAELVVMLARRLATDLPFNAGIFAPITLHCPEGTIVNSKPPAPIGAAHMHVGLNAADVAMQALTLALGASPEAPAHRLLYGAGFESALGTQLWSWKNPDGQEDAFLSLDGNWVGGSAGSARDGGDLGHNPVGIEIGPSFPDVEVLESWFPLLFLERRTRRGTEGAGMQRAGGGNQFSFRPHGVGEIVGTMFGMRRWLPLQGLGGGAPGALNEFVIHRADGSIEQLEVSSSGHVVAEGDWYEMRIASGGGFGDPLDRDPALVATDVARDRFTADAVRSVYGVVIDDDGNVDREATEAQRDSMRRARLERARPAPRPLDRTAVSTDGDERPLYPGVVQRGRVALAAVSGAPLAQAPDHWTDGCPQLVERRWDEGPDVVYRSYLDPETGRALHVEAALADAERTFSVEPRRWLDA